MTSNDSMRDTANKMKIIFNEQERLWFPLVYLGDYNRRALLMLQTEVSRLYEIEMTRKAR